MARPAAEALGTDACEHPESSVRGADATTLTQTGYVGEDVETCFEVVTGGGL